MKHTYLLAAAFGAPLLAQAQATPIPADTPATANALAPASVVVTGSRIARTSLEGP